MNTAKVQTVINELIAEQQTKQVARKQYPVAKHQIAKLTELGIIGLMPAKFGYTDAAIVIDAATTGKTALMNAFGEGEEIAADELNAALNETEVMTAETVAATIEIDLSDEDFSEGEKAEALNDAALLAVRKLNIEDVDAKQQMIEAVIDVLVKRYAVAL